MPEEMHGQYISIHLTPREIEKVKRLSAELGKPKEDLLRDYVRNCTRSGAYDPRVHCPPRKVA